MSTQIKQLFSFSPQQRRLWELQREGGAAAFHARCALLIEGGLDVERLRAALLGVVARHEILRTTFDETDEAGEPAQAVSDCGISWEYQDVAARDANLSEINLGDLSRGAEDFAADAGHEPPLRASLVRLAEGRHVLHLTLPALCADSPTLKRLAHELGLAYAADGLGEPEAEPLQYSDIARWLAELLASDRMSSGREHWRRLAEGRPAPFRLAFERTAAQPAPFDPRRVPVAIDAALLSRVEASAAALGAPPELLLHAAWQLLLWNHGRRPEELVVATAFDGLDYEELDGALGPLTRYLPIRCPLDPDMTFARLVAQTAARAREAHNYQQFYTADDAAADGTAPTFFPYCFDSDDGDEPFEAGGLTLSLLSRYACSDRFKLKLSCGRAGGARPAELHYDAGLFAAADAECIAAQLRALLESAAADVESRVGRLSLLDDEAERLLTASPGRGAKFGRGESLHRLFEAQARRTPDAVAVVCGEASLTYGELNERAERLAQRLRERGRGPESLVALCLGRTAELVVAILGVLKAGAAYLPLDPASPPERLAYMLRDSGAGVVLTQTALAELFAGAAAEVLRLDAEWQPAAPYGGVEPRPETSPENLAYVIYTSGSTGRPKGVMVTHANVTSLFEATRDSFGFTGEDVWTLFHSYAFDFSVWELWGALLYGGRLVVVPYLVGRSPGEFLGLLRREGVTVLNQTPSAFGQLTEAVRRSGEGAPSLRLVVFGGEALELSRLRPWYEAHGGAGPRLVNMYGITETTVHVTRRALSAADAEGARGSLIGGPIESLELYVLDGEGRPVPEGVAGELYVGGEGVARGYLGRPALTAERFGPHPFSREPGARLYRTGDVARRVGVELEYLGRADRQVKVRGYRIETGEVEAALCRHPDVTEAVVVARENVRGDKFLVGYYVGREGGTPGGAELRAHLGTTLPEYMIPSVFAPLKSLPLTPNGKLDRKALPAPEEAGQTAARRHAEARTPVEEMLCAVWSEVLGRSQVNVTDDFFELGGHSLLGTQMISRVREAFGIELPLSSLFEYPTLGALARQVEEALAQSNGLSRPPVERVPRGGDLAVSYNVEGRLSAEEYLRANSLSVRPQNISLAFLWSGPLDRDVLERSLNEVVRRHEVLRSSFSVAEGRMVQRVLPDVRVPLRVFDIRGVPEGERKAEARRLLAAVELERFDLAEVPLLRAAVVRLADEEYAAAFVVDHAVFDGWSSGVFIREITSLYRAFSADAPSPLAEPTIQYADFAAWQRNWVRGEVLERLLGYWRKQLAGHSVFPELDLPGGRPREEIKSFHGAGCTIRLSAELSRDLQALGRRSGATGYMVLLAGLKALLQRRTGLESIGLITPVAYRNTVETESLIGWFSNVLVLRTDLSGDPTFSELLARVRETALGAFSHQDIPFRLLKTALAQPESPEAKPKVQSCVFFSMNTEPAAGRRGDDADAPPMNGVRLRPININSKTAEPGLSINVDASDEAFDIVVNYEAECFEPAVMTTLLEHYEGLLASVVADPEQRLSAIPLLTRTRAGRENGAA